jgi:renalase
MCTSCLFLGSFLVLGIIRQNCLLQVHKAYPDSPGCVVLSETPAIILAGDAFTHSNFDGCVDSAISVQQTLAKLVKSKV